MSGRVVHFEIPYDDRERAGSFYADTFGWKVQPMPDIDYVLVATGPSEQGPPSEPGFVNGGMLQRGRPATGPVLVIDVEDIDATLEQVEAAGGQTVVAREAIGEMGFAAYFTDPEGNLLGLWQNA